METSLTTEAEVFRIVLELAPDGAGQQVESHSRLAEDLAYHSLALVELGFAIERAFGLDPISAEDVEDVRTAGDLADFVTTRLGH